ncbi:hypothetical protein THASP1DRAFT_34517 [Thamnocephalis sphaerospora]|uniref:Alpha-aminoadipate reductase n=1 Tax=Thamnocephalis sphaerospora TaxID=78915 RepID=A0A4P9XS40_9FUNG|nr:hypothetical protein THASP1DRAFT_34517 [Thamnocephalis sphaerospora]|eukprot:RKP08944.1 hypothetical protein THASP1DRAFT_34517 [Thamnocephalis sphaerospora]
MPPHTVDTVTDPAVLRWLDRLSGLAQLHLPTDYPRPTPLKVVEGVHAVTLGREVGLALLRLSLNAVANTNAMPPSPFTILLAAFVVLMHRYTGDEDVVVGSSSVTANPLVLRVRLTADDTLEDVIRKVQKVEEEAAADEVPFALLLDALWQRDRTKTGATEPVPPFKVRFFERTDTNPNTLAQTTMTDLTVFVHTHPSTLRQLWPKVEVQLVYNQVLFSARRMEHLVAQLIEVIERGAGARVGHLSLVTSLCRTILPDPAADLRWRHWPGPITERFVHNARAHPERACVVEGIDGEQAVPRIFTYQQICRAALRVCEHLVRNGIEREDVVVIYAYRGVDLVVAIMGVLMAGATFSVIDPAYPPARQNIYLSVAQPRAVIMLRRAGTIDPEVRKYIDRELDLCCEVPALELLDDGQLVGGQLPSGLDTLAGTHGEDDSAMRPVGIDSIGTLSFTSGSTGIPKGVRGRHYSLTHFYPWMAEEFGLDETARFTMLSGIAHDPIQRDIFTPLFFGAELRVPTAEDIGTPGRLSQWMADQQVTVTHLTPAMGQLLSANATTPIPSLRAAFFVGDILTKRDCHRLQRLAHNCRIVNMYGTTETQRAVSYFAIPSLASDPSYLTSCKEVIPAGQGMRDVQLLVVNRASRGTCGVGEVGEIYVRSGGLSEGYLRLEDVTREKFLVNWFADTMDTETEDADTPFYKGLRDRMYRTGDLGRYRPDGNVECTGRADDQVKIRGFRIELGEIDTHLSQHPRVRENVTLVRRDKNEEQTLVAYFVPTEDAAAETTPGRRNYRRLIRDIREYLKTKLPSYSVPSLFVPMTKMPLTPNGKVDKPALPFPDTAILRSQMGGGRPKKQKLTPTEQTVHDIWARCLNQPSMPVNENFFDLGGHSILATRMIFEVRKELCVDVPLGLVFQEPTIRGMSRKIDRIRGFNIADDDEEEQAEATRQDTAAAAAAAALAATAYASDLPEMTAQLPDSYPVTGAFPLANKDRPAFFLTGATGFLGAFVLAELLRRHPKSQVYCLVRASDQAAALERVRKNCRAHLVWQESWETHESIVAVVGDLARPKLGIAPAVWDELADKIDVIVHNGALVHWVYPYQKLRAPNVLGTLEALRLAADKRIKPFHFVSSTSVLDTNHYVRESELRRGEGKGGVLEADDLEGSRTGLGSGYGQSKWVAEKLIMEARRRGLPATIIRPGYILGDATTGVTNSDDFIWRLVKGCVQLGKVPEMHNVANMCPVDYVARATVAIASSEHALTMPAFHIFNSQRFRFTDLFQALPRYGYHVQSVEYVAWRKQLMDLTLNAADNALYPLLHFVLDDLPTSTKAPELDTANTHRVLEGSDVVCPHVEPLLGLYLAFLVKAGFLEAPPADAVACDALPQLDIPVTLIGRTSGN